MDTDWTRDLKPDEAQAALDALNAHKAPVTAREATELLRLKRAAGESRKSLGSPEDQASAEVEVTASCGVVCVFKFKRCLLVGHAFVICRYF